MHLFMNTVMELFVNIFMGYVINYAYLEKIGNSEGLVYFQRTKRRYEFRTTLHSNLRKGSLALIIFMGFNKEGFKLYYVCIKQSFRHGDSLWKYF